MSTNILKLGMKWSVKSWHTKGFSISFLSLKKINKMNEHWTKKVNKN